MCMKCMGLWKVTVICSQKEIAIQFIKINSNFGFPLLSKGLTSQNFTFKNDILLREI